MKLKKKHFKKLKEIAKAVNEIVPGTGARLDKLIAEIESVQKEKIETIQEKPITGTAAFLDACIKHQKEVEDSIQKERDSIAAASGFVASVSNNDKSTTFDGGLRAAVETLADPKIGDVGYFSTGSPNNHITYSRIRDYNGNKYQDIHGDWYCGFSKTPPELK